MIHEVTMPAMGADMTEGTVVKWLKNEGDEVARGDKLAEIETDKTVVEMEAYNAGILRRIVLGDGTKAPVGSLLAYIGGADDELPGAEVASPAPVVETVAEPEPEVELEVAVPQPVPEPVETVAAAPAPPAPTVEGGRIKASPLARRLASEKGFELAAIPGTGPGGRITRDDVLGFMPAPAFAPSGVGVAAPSVAIDGSDIELTTMRQAIARVTVRSKTEAPHYYVTTGVDMTDAMAFRAQLNAELEDSGARVSVNDMIIKALAMAIVKYPKWNTTFHMDRLEGHDSVNIGVAIALEAGLIVPALLGVHNMSLVDVSNASKGSWAQSPRRRRFSDAGRTDWRHVFDIQLGNVRHRYFRRDHRASSGGYLGSRGGQTDSSCARRRSGRASGNECDGFRRSSGGRWCRSGYSSQRG